MSVNTAAANRDPAVYDDPDRFDIKRVGAPPHLTFGGGIHYCLGVHLAKAELAEALVQMRAKWPTIEQTGPAPWKPVIGISGPITLPVRVERDVVGKWRRSAAPGARSTDCRAKRAGAGRSAAADGDEES